MLKSGDVLLRPLKEKDVETLFSIMNNLKVKSTLRDVLPINADKIKKMIEVMERCPYPTSIIFGIEYDSKLVGVISIDKINWISRNAYISIAIYDEEYQNKGIGKTATKMLLEYAFNYLNLYKINLEVYEYNKAAINMYKKLGFKEEGRLRENNERFGKRHDVIIMGITKDEF